MRVFHLIKSLGRGGAEVLLAEGLRHADRSRFTYGYGYFLPWKDAVVPELEAQGADVTCFGGRSSVAILASAGRVARHLRAWDADLVHAHLPVAGIVARLAGRLAGVPVVYTEHNLQERYHPATRRLNRATWRLQAGAIAVSEDVAASIERTIGGRVPVRVVLNGVDVDAFRGGDAAAVRQRHGIAPEAPVVGCVAVFRTQKRLDDWLAVAARVRTHHPNARFLLVGDGPLREALEARAEALGLGDAVVFPGFREDVRDYVAAMDVYLMTSQFEGLPIALLEAMALSRAIVATAVGGIPEALYDERDGLLAPPADLDRIEDHVVRLLSDADRRAALGRAARARVEDAFSMARMMRELEAFYSTVHADHVR